MNIDNNLNTLFNLEPIEGALITKSGEVLAPSDKAIEYDCEKSRNNLHTLLQNGQDALNYAIEIAKDSENPRAFEVVGNLMKQLADINHQLLDIHLKKQKMTTKEPEKNTGSVTNNAIFVGTSTDLNKMIEKMTKGES